MTSEPIVYWKSLDELRRELRRELRQEQRPDVPQEEPRLDSHAEPPQSPTSLGTTRRDFLGLMGFSLGAAACSRAPVEHALPFVRQPETITPGVATWYATTCGACPASCSLLVKTRDGRPIKIEGNDQSSLFGGGTCAVGQAAVLSLYDEARLRGPLWHGAPATWEDIDARVADQVRAASAVRERIVLLTGPTHGPSTRDLIARWSRAHPTFQHIVHAPRSQTAIARAYQACIGRAIVPHHRFDRASLIVSLDADFLGTWLSPVEFTHQYVGGRAPNGVMSRHVHIESGLSLTGANADTRYVVPPSAMGRLALALLDRVRALAGDPIGQASADERELPPIEPRALDALASQLWRHRRTSLIVAGAQDVATQTIVAALNQRLGTFGTTIDLSRVSQQMHAAEDQMAALVSDMQHGRVGVLIVYGVNPAYDDADAAAFVQGLSRVRLSVSFAERLDETAAHVQAVCPDHHFLEAWADAEPVTASYSLAQPTIAPLFDTRAAQDSLLRWLGERIDFHTYLRSLWRAEIHPRQQREPDFDRFWDRTLQAGVFELEPAPSASSDTTTTAAVTATATADVTRALDVARAHVMADDDAGRAAQREGRLELQLYETVALRDGRHANNPWLQELPDPITKITWGHAAAIAPALAQRLGVDDGDVVTIAHDGADGRARSLELPVCVQPGQSPATVSIAVGYGRTHGGPVGRGVGVNAFPFMFRDADGLRRTHVVGVTATKTGRHETLARTQTHHTMDGRPLVREIALTALLTGAAEESREGARAGSREGASFAANGDTATLPSLWSEPPHGRHTWGMAIDLNACTGCSACLVACQAENNVPVVGKDEVRRGREMHWIRIDRYYRGSADAPDTVFQPVMCQHCANAPCETVCPVLATVHSSDGLNQQVYNRCIGTRYCENNCPYKVRRFNWFTYANNARFDFTMNSPLTAMVLNPDVTVRSRGVMEKCSLCVQRIQDGRRTAQQEGREVRDGDIRTACQQACPAQAIVFGDLQNPATRVAQLAREARHYHLLANLGTRPTVGYLSKVRHREG